MGCGIGTDFSFNRANHCGFVYVKFNFNNANDLNLYNEAINNQVRLVNNQGQITRNVYIEALYKSGEGEHLICDKKWGKSVWFLAVI